MASVLCGNVNKSVIKLNYASRITQVALPLPLTALRFHTPNRILANWYFPIIAPAQITPFGQYAHILQQPICICLHGMRPGGTPPNTSEHLRTPPNTSEHLRTPRHTFRHLEKWPILKVSATLPYPCTSFLVHPLTVHRCASGAKLRPLPADISAISSNSMAFAAPCCLHLTSISFSIHFIWAKG